MKKMNKKGFTLIELLAVIIILGILMIIAIPSVTTYIQNSRKSAFVDTASAYIDAVRAKVNEGEDLKLFATKTLYLIPVGNTSISCVSVESGGKSPFSDTWEYAYVGVVYNGKGYDYYFVGQDGAKQGIAFVSDDTLSKHGNDLIYSSTKESTTDGITVKVGDTNLTHKISAAAITTLTTSYNGTDVGKNLDSNKVISGSGTSAVYEIASIKADDAQFEAITTKDGNTAIDNYVIIGSCKLGA